MITPKSARWMGKPPPGASLYLRAPVLQRYTGRSWGTDSMRSNCAITATDLSRSPAESLAVGQPESHGYLRDVLGCPGHNGAGKMTTGSACSKESSGPTGARRGYRPFAPLKTARPHGRVVGADQNPALDDRAGPLLACTGCPPRRSVNGSHTFWTCSGCPSAPLTGWQCRNRPSAGHGCGHRSHLNFCLGSSSWRV